MLFRIPILPPTGWHDPPPPKANIPGTAIGETKQTPSTDAFRLRPLFHLAATAPQRRGKRGLARRAGEKLWSEMRWRQTAHCSNSSTRPILGAEAATGEFAG
jgi:hypothetical protein